MKKQLLNFIFLLLLTGVISTAAVAIFRPQEKQTYSTIVKAPSDSNIVAQETTTSESRIEIEIVKQRADYSPNRYDLKVTPHNITDTQYGYIVELDSYSSSLIHDTSRAAITYSGHYSSGKNHNQNTRYYFEPEGNHAEDTSAGTLSLRLLQNTHDTPTVGTAQVTVIVYHPTTKIEVTAITQQLCFDIE